MEEMAVGTDDAPRPGITSLSPHPAPGGGDYAQGERIDCPGHEGPGSEVIGAASGLGEAPESGKGAVGAAETNGERRSAKVSPRMYNCHGNLFFSENYGF